MKKSFLVLALALVMVSATAASAQVPDLNSLIPQGNGTVTSRIIQIVALLTVLSVAPGLLVMVTSFTRFAVALSFLRSGLGLQSTPANLILISLSLFMTFYVMAPTFERAWDDGVKPLMNNSLSEEEAFGKIVEPFRGFMMAQVRDKDLKLFEDLARDNFKTKDQAKGEIRVLIPAFMISELRRGFEIGFLIALPFLVIDMIVSTLTMSMGMMMLPPSVIALPIKILFFILIDGWNLLIGKFRKILFIAEYLFLCVPVLNIGQRSSDNKNTWQIGSAISIQRHYAALPYRRKSGMSPQLQTILGTYNVEPTDQFIRDDGASVAHANTIQYEQGGKPSVDWPCYQQRRRQCLLLVDRDPDDV